jgi:mannosyltransferase
VTSLAGVRADRPAAPTDRGRPGGRLRLRRRAARSLPAAAALAVAAFAGAVSLVGAGIPSLWGDEVVSIMSARRSWSSLVDALRTVDAVHGLYYVILHLWVAVFGSDAVAVRALSALAIALAAGGMVPLVRALGGGLRPAVTAGIALALLPRVAYAGSDARSAALEMAGAVAVTLLLARGAVTRPGWRWAVYGLALGALVVLFLYTALLIAAHLVLVLLLAKPAERGVALRRFAAAAGIALGVASPVLVAGWLQRGQVAFLADRDPTLRTVLITPWFGDAALAVVAGGLLLLALLALARRGRSAHTVAVALAWLMIPSTVILLAGAVLGGFYAPRYVSFTAPAVALLMAIGVEELVRLLPTRAGAGAVVAVLALVAGLAAPVVVAQRQPSARNAGTDWNRVADVIGAHARPGDGIAFDDGVRHSRRPRLALHAYPESFRSVVDLGMVRPYDRTDGLWDATRPLTPALIDRVDRMWLVTRSGHGADADIATMRTAGLHRGRSWPLDSDVVSLWVRG